MSSEKRKYELKARAEGQRLTRERIVRATMELHQELGPAQTTIAEIARRAGVQRLTVYNHFPEEAELIGACQAHWLSLYPLPDLGAAVALPEPRERLRAVLRGYYGWYRATEPMAEKVQRDRGAVAPLDELLQQTADPGLAQLAEALAAGFAGPGRAGVHQRALIQLALDFWTWRRLDREGLDDDAAAALMADAVATAGRPPGWLRKDEYDAIYSRVPRLCVEVVITDPRRGVLLTLRDIPPNVGAWHIPGGTVLFAEPLSEAVKRVACDELGLEVAVGELLGYIEYPSHYENGLDSPVGMAFVGTPASGPIGEDRLPDGCAWFSRLPDGLYGEQRDFLISRLGFAA